jgi:hypothetical protein
VQRGSLNEKTFKVNHSDKLFLALEEFSAINSRNLKLVLTANHHMLILHQVFFAARDAQLVTAGGASKLGRSIPGILR